MNNDATNQPVSLNNEATPDAAVFASATPALTASAAAGAGAASGGEFIAIEQLRWVFWRMEGFQHRERESNRGVGEGSSVERWGRQR